MKTVVFMAASLILGPGALAQNTTAPVPPPRRPEEPVDQAHIPPPFSSAAAVYSGISGPGGPQVGNGTGGWRSGYEHLRYDGPDAKPGWLPLGEYACTASAVKNGLLPSIKPIWDLHLRDTVINLGGDGMYYMTGSSGDNIWDRNDGIELWRSKDLRSWDYLGLVWSFEKDATWQKEWKRMHGVPARNVWAPEIHYLRSKKNYFLTYSLSTGGTGILASTTGKPEGPYVSPLKPDTRLTGGIDATLFEDDDGKVYMTWGRGGSIALMKEDMSGFDGEPRRVVVDKTGGIAGDGSTNVPEFQRSRAEIAQEGASLFKHDAKYYLGGATFWGGPSGRYSSVVAIADNIWGPYRQYHEAVPCGGGTNYFHDKDDNWWCCFFGNDEEAPFREKPGLIRIDFDPDGKIKIADRQPAWVLQDGAPTRWRQTNGPQGGDIVPAPPPAAPGTGFSGPGAVHGPQWSRYNEKVTGSAVKEGLLPDLKPLIPDLQIRDTVIRLGGDGMYYLTGSSGADIWDHNDGVELWRSPDLKKWDYLGLVWTFEKDGTWEKNWRWHHKPVRALWAPELHYIKRLKNYFITLSMPPGNRGILRSTTGKPEGPYVNALANDGYLKGGIDGTLFEDDDGKVYYTSDGGGTIWEMNEDLSGFVGEGHKIAFEKPADGSWTRSSIAQEGVSLFKRDGKYYLGGAAFYKGRYSSVVAISDTLFGPYTHWHEAVPCGAGGDYFQDKEGNWWCVIFGNDDQASFREKPAMVKIEFDRAGLIHVAKDQPDFVLNKKP